MGIPSTIAFTDLYGPTPPGHGKTGPSDTEKASGSTGPISSNKPMLFWVAMIGMLFVARMLWEKGS
jgi:hypothetical protein